MSIDVEIHRGLAGVFVDTTSVSNVVAETNSLTYRGYPVQELCASCSFEEVAYLIWFGELANSSELDAFTKRERSQRELSASVIQVLNALPVDCHPMDSLRTAVSFLGAEDPGENDSTPNGLQAKSEAMFAKIPTVIALDYRRRKGLDPIPSDTTLGFVENFFQMCFGSVPDQEVLDAFEISMILYAEHSFN